MEFRTDLMDEDSTEIEVDPTGGDMEPVYAALAKHDDPGAPALLALMRVDIGAEGVVSLDADDAELLCSALERSNHADAPKLLDRLNEVSAVD